MTLRLTLGAAALILYMDLASAGVFTHLQEADERKTLGPPENCGVQPTEPGFIGSLYNSSEKTALTNFYACRSRNERRLTLRSNGEMQNIVDRTTTSCQNAVRKLSSNPSTLSFDLAKFFSWKDGLNGSGVDITDGGYSVRISGSDISGRFSLTCYMEKTYNVTNVR